MRKPRFTEARILGVLQEAERGRKPGEVIRQPGNRDGRDAADQRAAAETLANGRS